MIFPPPITNRLTTGWKLTGTTTWRLASSKMLGTIGTNLQNPSHSLMRCVVPDDGCVFLQPDQSGAEALIVAMEAPKGKFRRLFELGLKVHSYLALQIFVDKFAKEMGQPPDRYTAVDPDTLAFYEECKPLFKIIKNRQREYDLGKRAIHAKNYKMGWKTFQVNCLEMSEGTIALSPTEAKHILNTHETTFPEIQVWQHELEQSLIAGRTLRNLFGFPRTFYRTWSPSLIREACAFIPQSTVGTITNLAFVETYHYIRSKKLPWMLLNNKHDSLLLQCPDTKEHIDHARMVLKSRMERDLVSSNGEAYQMKSGMSIGHNWDKWSPENPDGMKEEE